MRYKAVILSMLFFLSIESKEPSSADWAALNQSVGNRLIRSGNPFAGCTGDSSTPACKELLKIFQNPYLIQQHPWGTQSIGWMNAWTTAASPFVIEAQKTEDIVAAVNFAREHQLKFCR